MKPSVDLTVLPANLEKRFWAKVQVTPKCWFWTSPAATSGYGQIAVFRHPAQAHRVAYRIYYNIDPGAFCVCHICDIKLCVNPGHLFLGTVKDNMADKISKGRSYNQLKVQCKRGHKYDSVNTRYNLNGSRSCRECDRINHRKYTLDKLL